ncbi:hypothetical protein [Enterococcus cecorum]|uniref:hypothetical protein n=1 Tax=Enterococcus cecorum TaxID=44008 RepID=UPI00148B8F5B|nr:hypothetical protein [Enterococcus cecorum]
MERKERKTYRKVLGTKTVDRLIDQLYDKGYEHSDFSEASLLDNHLFFLDDNVRIGRIKARKYLFFVEKYLNSWSSCYEMVLTDSQKVYDELYSGYFDYE